MERRSAVGEEVGDHASRACVGGADRERVRRCGRSRTNQCKRRLSSRRWWSRYGGGMPAWCGGAPRHDGTRTALAEMSDRQNVIGRLEFS